jgi:hypothetical protein
LKGLLSELEFLQRAMCIARDKARLGPKFRVLRGCSVEKLRSLSGVFERAPWINLAKSIGDPIVYQTHVTAGSLIVWVRGD